MRLPRSVLFLICAASAVSCQAHTLPISYLVIVPDTEYLHLELTFNPFELTFARELDSNHNGRIDPQEWDARQSLVCERILECLSIRVNDRLIPAAVSGIAPDLDSHHATLRAHYHVDARTGSVRIESRLAAITSSSHLTHVTFGGTEPVQRAKLDAQTTAATFQPADRALQTKVNSPRVQRIPAWLALLSSALMVLLLSIFIILFGRSRRHALVAAFSSSFKKGL